MARLILVLLLALSIRPAEAGASMHAQQHAWQALHDVPARYSAEVLHSLGRLRLLQGVAPQHLGSGVERSQRGSGDPLEVLSDGGPCARSARLLAGPRSTGVDAAVSPLCENLPYFATAPPSSR